MKRVSPEGSGGLSTVERCDVRGDRPQRRSAAEVDGDNDCTLAARIRKLTEVCVCVCVYIKKPQSWSQTATDLP